MFASDSESSLLACDLLRAAAASRFRKSKGSSIGDEETQRLLLTSREKPMARQHSALKPLQICETEAQSWCRCESLSPLIGGRNPRDHNQQFRYRYLCNHRSLDEDALCFLCSRRMHSARRPSARPRGLCLDHSAFIPSRGRSFAPSGTPPRDFLLVSAKTAQSLKLLISSKVILLRRPHSSRYFTMLFTWILTVLATALAAQARGGSGGGRGGSGGRGGGGFVDHAVYLPESSTSTLLDKRTASRTQSTPLSSPSPASTSGVFTGGNATFYYQNNTAGACGVTHPDSDLIVALDVAVYGASTGVGPNCGRQVHITNLLNGQNVTATVADKCPGCPNANSLDLSTGAFDQIADESLGTVPIEWYYLSNGTDGTTAQ